MSRINLNYAKLWQTKFKENGYSPKLIFGKTHSRTEILFALSFFIMIMSVEILFNQPFKKKIRIFHNNFYKTLFKDKYEKLERIQINSFAFGLFLIFQKLFEENEKLKQYVKEIISHTVCHWSCSEKFNKRQHDDYLQKVIMIWETHKKLVLSRTYDSRIDLIFLLYKSFELGVGDKKIIKKNLSVLIFSVSKSQKEFRYDVLKELKNL